MYKRKGQEVYRTQAIIYRRNVRAINEQSYFEKMGQD